MQKDKNGHDPKNYPRNAWTSIYLYVQWYFSFILPIQNSHIISHDAAFLPAHMPYAQCRILCDIQPSPVQDAQNKKGAGNKKRE